eukprot:s4925_g4.t1
MQGAEGHGPLQKRGGAQLAMLREVLAQERDTNRAHLPQSLEVVQRRRDLFVPGVCRGYAIFPIQRSLWNRKRPGEPGECECECNKLFNGCATPTSRPATTTMGDASAMDRNFAKSGNEEKGKACGKGQAHHCGDGDPRQIEVEFATGTIWNASLKVCSATAEKPRDADKAGAVWMDMAMLATVMRKTAKDVQAAWEPRKAELQR